MALTRVARNLPLQVFFQAMYAFRRYVFAKDPEPVTELLVEDVGVAELEALFLDDGLIKGDFSSFHYYGEELNMVCGVYRDDEYQWYQYHVRGFEVEGGTRLRPHTELYWRMYPKLHMQQVNCSVAEAIETTEEILEAAGLSYTRLPPSDPDERS